jgi:hypothetical protein
VPEDRVLLTGTSGGATVTLSGTNLGGDVSACVVTWNGRVVAGVRVSAPHSSLVFSVPEGPGGPVSLGLEVGGQSVSESNASLPSLAYRAPMLQVPTLYDSTDPFECLPNGNMSVTGGNATLLLLGSDFGDGTATNV